LQATRPPQDGLAVVSLPLQLLICLSLAPARLEKQIEALTAGLQKVSAQLELSKAAPQTVLNHH
jgi:hypothetical protein